MRGWRAASQNVSRGSADTQAAAEQVHGFSRSLSQEGNALKLEVGKFLKMVRRLMRD